MNIELKKVLIKSKSSNTAMSRNDVEASDKKSKSSGGLQGTVMRKRGVYVERTGKKSGFGHLGNLGSLITEMQETSHLQTRDGKSILYSSVLAMHSKTAPIPYSNLEGTANTAGLPTDNQRPGNLLDSKKKRYKSKVLNSGYNNADDIIVLKQRTVQDTSSNISYHSNTKIDSLKSIADEIRSGRRLTEAEFDTVKEPKTLIGSKKEDKVYKLFVDLITDTLEDDAPNKKAKDRHSRLVMEEAVADKLTLKGNELSDTEASEVISLETNPNVFYTDNFINIDSDRYKAAKNTKAKKAKKKNKKAPPKVNYVNENKVLNKQELIKILKKELAMDPRPYHEPQNFYEALSAIASTKRRTHEQFMKDSLEESSSSADEDNDRHYCKRSLVGAKKPRRKVKSNKKPVKARAKPIPETPGYESSEEYVEDYEVDNDYEEYKKPKTAVAMFDPKTPEYNPSKTPVLVLEPVDQENDAPVEDKIEENNLNKERHKSLTTETDFDFPSSVSNFSFSQSDSYISESDSEIEGY